MIQSPIKLPEIRVDKYGDGHFMAPRGERFHRGLDLVVVPGDKVFMPIHGTLARLAYPYADDLKWQGALITNEHWWIKIFYFRPNILAIGKDLKMGEHIGTAQNIASKYGKGMIPHIHFELMMAPMQGLTHDGRIIGNEVFINPEPLIM